MKFAVVCGSTVHHLTVATDELALCGRGWLEVSSIEFNGDLIYWSKLCKRCLELSQKETQEPEADDAGGEYVLSI